MGHEEKGQQGLQGMVGSLRIQADPGKVICTPQHFLSCGAQHHGVNCVVFNVDQWHGGSSG